MPMPKAIGTHGSSRPAPASAATHSRRRAANDGHAVNPDGAKPPACAAPRGGQVPANPCVRPGDLPRSAIGLTPQPLPLRCYRKLSGGEKRNGCRIRKKPTPADRSQDRRRSRHHHDNLPGQAGWNAKAIGRTPSMTGRELKQLRDDLAEAIGRPLSAADMAKLCGLEPRQKAKPKPKLTDKEQSERFIEGARELGVD